MPGPYIHIAASDRVRTRLREFNSWGNAPATAGLPPVAGPSREELATLANAHPSYYALGAIGPDLFFFLPDFRALCIRGRRIPIANSLIGVLEFLDGLYEAFDSWILEDWERYFGPGNENVEEALSRLTGDLSTVVMDIIGKLSSIGTNALVDLVAMNYDWWGLFGLGLNKGYDNQDFFWSDMLHYRRTSHFAQSLWNGANLREQSGQPTPGEATAAADKLRAYALGYMTHVGTDTAGHAFVNEKSGGPFRTHWQRHHLIENHMDAQTYDVDEGRKPIYNRLTESALHYRLLFKDSGDDDTRLRPHYVAGDDSLRARYVRRRHLDIDSAMPEELAELIVEAMETTYDTGTPPTPATAATSSPRIIPGPDGRPDVPAVQTAYLLLFRYLKLSMLDGFNHEKPQPPDLFPNLDFPILTDPHDDPPNAGDEDMSFWDWCFAIIRFIKWLEAVALWIVTILPAILLDVATYLPRLAAYYAIQLPLYYMLKAERRIMVMMAFVHPAPDEIDAGLLRLCQGHDDLFLLMLQNMNDTLGGFEDGAIPGILNEIEHLVQILGISALEAATGILSTLSLTFSEPQPNTSYPHAQPVDAQGGAVEYHAPWHYPSSPTELSLTFAGPHECGEMPHVLLDGAMPGDQAMRVAYENAPSPATTDLISSGATKTKNLGDPVNFSDYLMWQLTRLEPLNDPVGPSLITDWNLDADRGYAYKCWDWNRHEPTGEFILHDMDGHAYAAPCTPPPQAEFEGQPGGGLFTTPCAPLSTERPDPLKPLKLHYADHPDPHCAPPGLSVSFEGRAGGVVTLIVANKTSTTVTNVKVTAIGPPPLASLYVGTPIPFIVGNLSPNGSAAFSLVFLMPTSSPFTLDLTIAADNIAPSTTTIHVP
jgi:hypothetical protein